MDGYSVEIQIGDRRYPVRVQSDQEEQWVREAARAINQRYQEIQLHITGHEPVDYLAMSCLLLLAEVNSHNRQLHRFLMGVEEQIRKLVELCRDAGLEKSEFYE
ncbi:MAG: cell division protein ZapA [Chitinophagales bacterium]|nr:cell division protein ZapA [Chitinophagales bacterium]MDW8427351.1 cell division protein ZapA [Chitinophagales bacterium]